jgi:hypothetical protein
MYNLKKHISKRLKGSWIELQYGIVLLVSIERRHYVANGDGLLAESEKGR